MLYYIETDYGCAIQSDENIKMARQHAREEVGRAFRLCRRATQDDIEWVKGMGGYIPKQEDA